MIYTTLIDSGPREFLPRPLSRTPGDVMSMALRLLNRSNTHGIRSRSSTRHQHQNLDHRSDGCWRKPFADLRFDGLHRSRDPSSRRNFARNRRYHVVLDGEGISTWAGGPWHNDHYRALGSRARGPQRHSRSRSRQAAAIDRNFVRGWVDLQGSGISPATVIQCSCGRRANRVIHIPAVRRSSRNRCAVIGKSFDFLSRIHKEEES